MATATSAPTSASKNSTVVRSRNAVRLTKAALQTAFVVSEDLGASFAERLFTSPRRHARPTREQTVLASARQSIVNVTLRSPRAHHTTLPIATWRWGRSDAPTILLVHGWEGRGSQLGAFVEPLVAAGLSVVAFDAPGHGNSPSNRLYLTDLADTITDVAATAAPAHQLHGIVAHSFGAAGVLLAGIRNGLRSPRNVMVAPNVIIDDAVRRFARLVGLDDADRLVLEQRLADHTGIHPESLHLDELTRARGTTADDTLLIIHDRDDREVAFLHGERLADHWPNAQLIPTTNLGHRRILRDPAVIEAAVAVLREGVEPPVSDLVREVDRQLDAQEPTP